MKYTDEDPLRGARIHGRESPLRMGEGKRERKSRVKRRQSKAQLGVFQPRSACLSCGDKASWSGSQARRAAGMRVQYSSA